jgi:hypothetical protein
MGGTSYVEFKLNDEVYDVFAGGTSLDGREKLGEVKLSDGWRGRVSYIVEEAPPYHEEKSPDDITVRGAKGLENQLLSAAWSGEKGAYFVSLMLELDDTEISSLIEQSLDDLATAIDSVAHARFEMGADDALILEEIRASLECGSVDWVKFKCRISARAEELRARNALELAAAKVAREQAIGLFQDRIDQALRAWGGDEAAQNPTGKLLDFKIFMQNYVVRRGLFPTGIVTVDHYGRSKWGNKKLGTFEVDLDSLK